MFSANRLCAVMCFRPSFSRFYSPALLRPPLAQAASLVQIQVPPLPTKALSRQIMNLFRSGDEGTLFAEDFIEERRKGLEDFINRVAGHPLAQNEKALHMFLQDPQIDKNYTPGKVRGR
eukprot:m.75640 g.75640  ORF g.75640 m.75640 type:complete len:119 (-) comp8090_c0_seq1:238-594(-)